MNNTTKNIAWGVGALIVIAFIVFFATRGGSGPTVGDNGLNGNALDYNGAGGEQQATAPGGTSKAKTTSGATAGSAAADTSLENMQVLATVIGNTLVRVPQTGIDVALTVGEANYTDTTGKLAGHISAGPIIGWTKTESGYDVFTDMTVTKTGQVQILHYVALFHVLSATNVKFTSAVLIGDRLPITGISASPDRSKSVNPSTIVMNSTVGYYVTVNYLQRKNAEPMTAAASLPVSVTLGVKNHIVSK